MRTDSVRDFAVGDRLTAMSLTRIERGYIYHLIDPRTNSVRYVGSTVNPTQRYNAHLYEARKTNYAGEPHTGRKNLWVRGLIGSGSSLVMEIVAVVDPAEMLTAEANEYARQISSGAHLLNRGKPNTGGWSATNASLGLLPVTPLGLTEAVR